MAYTEFVIKTK